MRRFGGGKAFGVAGFAREIASAAVVFLTIEYHSGVGSRPSLGVNAYAHYVFPT